MKLQHFLTRLTSWHAWACDVSRDKHDSREQLPTEVEFITIWIEWQIQGYDWGRCFLCYHLICHSNNWTPQAIKNIYDQGWCTAKSVREPRKRMWEICSWSCKFDVLVLFHIFFSFIFVPCFPDETEPPSEEGKKINFPVFLVWWRR